MAEEFGKMNVKLYRSKYKVLITLFTLQVRFENTIQRSEHHTEQ
jgi:hypothetical protein